MSNFSVLVVDDELAYRQILSRAIADEGYTVQTAADAYEAMKILAKGEISVAICDIRMPGIDGIELMKQVRAGNIDTTFIMCTAYASVDSAVLALKAGAADYIIKPVRNEEILHRLRQVEAMRDLQDENKVLRKIVVGNDGDSFVFESPAMANVERMIRKVAMTDSTVLITGESGTGKGVVARKIHNLSQRRKGPFIPVNCGAIPHNLMESEFFGHTKGAFTGADRSRKGLFLQADRGTLFLDEIGELPLELQPKLLHALEEKKVRAVGGEQSLEINARIIAATNRNVLDLIKQGRFREDLYFRLCGFEISVPPLRERKGDIPKFLDFVLRRESGKANGDEAGVSIEPQVDDILNTYDWPGNIREFENVISRALIMAEGGRITLSDLPPELTKNASTGAGGLRAAGALPTGVNLREKLRRIEAGLVLSTIEECNGDRKAAADLLEIGLSSLYRKLQEWEEEGFIDAKTLAIKNL
ncbi:MAG TPA: sigma-54 dependent transcriptional regulator [Rhodocyclaceae bacterium]